MSAIGRMKLFTLSPCGREWLREAKPGEGMAPHAQLPFARAERYPSSGALRVPPSPTRGEGKRERVRVTSLRFEKRVSRVLRCALFLCGFFQPRDLRGEKCHAFAQLLDREQRQVLSDLVRDLLLRPVVFFDGHAAPPLISSASGLVARSIRAG